MKLIHLTDTHLAAPGEQVYGIDPRARLDACIADIQRHHADADLLVLTGNLTHFGDRAAYENLRAGLSHLSMPMRFLLGDHDRPDAFRKVFRDAKVDGRGNVQSVMDTDLGRFIFVDTSKTGTHAGWYDDERLDWLDERFRESEGQPVFLFMHHPPFKLGVPAIDATGLIQGFEFVERIGPHLPRVRHLFFGHAQRPVSGSWRGVPFSTPGGTCHQMALDYADARPRGVQEAPAYDVAFIDAHSVIVHRHAFLADAEPFSLSEGAYSFWEEQERRRAAG